MVPSNSILKSSGGRRDQATADCCKDFGLYNARVYLAFQPCLAGGHSAQTRELTGQGGNPTEQDPREGRCGVPREQNSMVLEKENQIIEENRCLQEFFRVSEKNSMSLPSWRWGSPQPTTAGG